MTDTDDPAAQWLPHVEAWEKSGQSQPAYCREHNLVKTRFTYWKLKLRPTMSRHQADSVSGFVPLFWAIGRCNHRTPAEWTVAI
jgi:hypothetical protein